MPPLNSPQITETQHPVPIQGPQRLWIHRQNVTQSDQVDLEVQRQQQAQSQPHIYNYTQHLQQLQWQQQQLVQHEYERQRHQQLQGNANLGITELMGHVHSTNPGL
ncbi:hypothetical protein BU24DRAFT_420199 [Aaosphaeria arxii CBS 175.79]|uniref:Uncharacterized protein n=1 Tax=Aaosphaeria arxii CBS 175.79 TaxID=1450172 RepID=A0A6A5XWU4_9PLEO|nr:uncharacterized protein BU24DRAFT_420199 [Aaosphaeria arxii CBS 175.79]KAF2017171.1 hypothetical protein BU24DRAFT_420199 [Aaosphaeria arxii CBS 175.79]